MTNDALMAWAERIANSQGWTGTCIQIRDFVRAVLADEREAAKPEPPKPEPGVGINDAAALRRLVSHCWVHSGYPDCGYDQMDSKMKSLYDALRGREPDADEKPEPGDVPEWIRQAFFDAWFDAGGKTISFEQTWAGARKLNSEITRRVAEATAKRDKRIAELETEVKRAIVGRNMHCGDANAKAIEITKLKQQLAERDGWLRDACKDKDYYMHEATTAYEQLNTANKQLAASQAEVENLKGVSFLDARNRFCAAVNDVANALGHNDKQCYAPEAVVRWAKEADAELTKLREENARLSRPVDVDLWTKWRNFPGMLPRFFIDVANPLLQAERNVREAAEAERDELREAVNKYVAISNTSDENKKYTLYAASERHGAWGNRCIDYVHDTPADAVLAAYRAEKAKVQG